MRYGYNAKGQRTETRTDKLTTKYAYDAAGNLVSQSTTGAYDLAFEYDYDKAGRITQESRTENGATLTSDYAYDKLGQLTGFERSDGYTESYVYDPVGNMLSKTRNGVRTDYTYNAANQLVSDGENKYTYDKNGNLVQKGSTKYTYNAQNLLESWTDGEHSESYSYNASRLLSSVTNDEGTTSFAWDILTGDGVVIAAESGGETTDYLYGLERIAALNGKNKTEYAYDGRGSVAAELRYTDAWYTLGGALSKADVTSKSYTPFGEQIGEALSGFGYNGEYYNANTGMVYLRARFYEPEMNRFSQKDILWGDITVPNSLNSYAYVQNDPVNYCDPSGMRQVKGIDASGTSGSIYSVKKTATSSAAVMSARAGTMAYMYTNEARMNGSAAAAKKAQQAIQQAYSYANEARMNGNGSSVYKTYGALQAAGKQVNYTNSRGSKTAAEAAPKVESVDPKQNNGCNTSRQYTYAPGENTPALCAGNYDGIGDSIRGLADITPEISSISSFAYGLYHTMNSSLVEGEAGRLVDEAYSLMERGVYGSQVTKNFELSAKLKAIGRRSSALSGVAAFAGGVIDLIYQLKTNASVSAAVTKTASHVLLGMAGGAIAAALVGAIPAIFVVAASAAVSIFLSNQVDRGIDYIEEKTGFFSKIDNMVSDFLFN